MSVKYGKFEMPEQIIIEQGTATNQFGRFIAEPFERGFGHTLGNSLRRMILTSLEAPAIVSVRLEGVPHEYTAIEGIVEDMTNIILNLKGALLRKLPRDDVSAARESRILTKVIDVTQADLDANNGECNITLGDVVESGNFEVVNPKLHLFTVSVPMQKQIDLRVAFGRGYVPSERHMISDQTAGEILIDSAFSPIRLVHYHVENTRVGQDTDFDRLILEVTTDGRVTPAEALGFSTQILLKHFEVFKKVETPDLTFEEASDERDAEKDEIMEKLSLRIDEIELSVRSTNCLSGANIEIIAELVAIPERRMLEFRNFGKKSLDEIRKKLRDMGLSLGMDLSPYGITPDNIKEKVREFQEKQKELSTFEES